MSPHLAQLYAEFLDCLQKLEAQLQELVRNHVEVCLDLERERVAGRHAQQEAEKSAQNLRDLQESVVSAMPEINEGDELVTENRKPAPQRLCARVDRCRCGCLSGELDAPELCLRPVSYLQSSSLMTSTISTNQPRRERRRRLLSETP